MPTRTAKETIGILGYGEVGQAIGKCYKKPKIKDIKRDDGLQGVDILHICIPYGPKFIDSVSAAIKEIKPGLTIINSTVAPGTTQKISQKFPGDLLVHSPIRGVHPNLYKGIKTFVKFIGAQNKEAAAMAKRHFESMGINTKVVMPAAASELGKLLDTTYYGLCIAFHGEAKKFCDDLDVDFDDVMTSFNETYNEGYAQLKKTNVIRPVLKAPQGGIGGHCIGSNVEILQQFFHSEALDLIKKYKQNK